MLLIITMINALLAHSNEDLSNSIRYLSEGSHLRHSVVLSEVEVKSQQLPTIHATEVLSNPILVDQNPALQANDKV